MSVLYYTLNGLMRFTLLYLLPVQYLKPISIKRGDSYHHWMGWASPLVPVIHLGGERHLKSNVSCSRTQCDDQDLKPDLSV